MRDRNYIRTVLLTISKLIMAMIRFSLRLFTCIVINATLSASAFALAPGGASGDCARYLPQYRVTRNSVTVGHILGSVHSYKHPHELDRRGVSALVNSSRIVAFEFNLADPEESRKTMALRTVVTPDPAEARLRALLLANVGGSSEQKAAATTLFSSRSLLGLAMLVSPAKTDTEDQESVESIVFGQVKQGPLLAVAGLETAEQHAAALKNIPEGVWAGYFQDLIALSKSEQLRSKYFEIQEYIGQSYDTGNIELVMRALLAQEHEFPGIGAFEKSLTHSRNLTMLRSISRWMLTTKTQPAFVILGVSHLWGDDGTIQGLQREGFEVSSEPLCVKAK